MTNATCSPTGCVERRALVSSFSLHSFAVTQPPANDFADPSPANPPITALHPLAHDQPHPMKILPLFCSTVLSYLGWYAVDQFGFGWAFAVSSIMALVGVYVGWKIARHFGL